MAPLHIFTKYHAFSLIRPFGSISSKTVNLLLRVKFDGEGEVYAFDQISQFIHKFLSCGIFNYNYLCKLFTLTFKGRTKI